jgi:hypothetical protein
VTLASTMSSVNTTLRKSGGTSIIVRRLASPKAEDEECKRRKSAASAINSENVQSLSLRALQPSGVKLDARITLQPKIAGSALHKSRSIFVDPDLRRGLVKRALREENDIESDTILCDLAWPSRHCSLHNLIVARNLIVGPTNILAYDVPSCNGWLPQGAGLLPWRRLKWGNAYQSSAR